MNRLRDAWLMLGALWTAGCGGPESHEHPGRPSLAYEYTTEHLVVHSDAERCRGDLARWEGFAEHVETTLELPIPRTIHVYAWDRETYDEGAWCRLGADGCFMKPDVVYSIIGSIEHELVHAITTDLANEDLTFAEGLAVALAEESFFGVEPPQFFIESSPEVDYATAGHFVRWLLESFGPAPLLEFMAIAGAGPDDLEAIYGEDVITRYYDQAEPAYPRLYLHPAPALEFDGSVWTSTLVFDCEREDVRGRSEGLVVVREWTIEEGGQYAFWASVQGKIEVRARSRPSRSEYRGQTPSITTGWMDPGSYEVQVTAPHGVETGTIKVWRSVTDIPVWPEVP